MDTTYLRALLVRSLDPEKVRLGSFESTKIGGTGGVGMCAELIAITRNDRWIEQVAWRLSAGKSSRRAGRSELSVRFP